MRRNGATPQAVTIVMLMLRAFITGLVAAALAPSQQPPEQTFRTGVNVVVAPAVVTNRDGDYINGLGPNDFVLTDNGKRQNVKVDVTYAPISLVVAIQANNNAEPVLPKIQRIGSLLTGEIIGENGEAAILAFDHRMQVLQDFTNDTTRLQAALKKLRPGSTTSAMVDAVVAASRMLEKRPTDHRRVLLLISETRDNGSQAKVREALTDLQFGNVELYSVNINRLVTSLLAKPQPPRPSPIPPTAQPMPAGVPPTPENAAQLYGNPKNSANFAPLFVEIFRQAKAIFVDNPIEVFTKWTGGREHSFVSERDLEHAINSIGTELHSEYMLTYVPNNKDEGGFHNIEVSVPTHSEARVRTRPGYWVAAQPGP